MDSLEFDEIRQVLVVIFFLLVGFAIFNHSLRAVSKETEFFSSVDNLRLLIGSYVYQSASICPDVVSLPCYKVSDAFTILFGLHR